MSASWSWSQYVRCWLQNWDHVKSIRSCYRAQMWNDVTKIVTISQTCHKQFATNIHHQNRFSRLYSQVKHRTERLRSCLMCFIYTYLLTSPLRAKLNYQNSIICTISIAPLRSYLNSELTILFFNDYRESSPIDSQNICKNLHTIYAQG